MKPTSQTVPTVDTITIVRHFFSDDGTFPNNSLLPLIIYKAALTNHRAESVSALFESNDWGNSWEDGVYDYHHYHSTAHEVLAVVRGEASMQFGGPSGQTFLTKPGDVVIIPAGVAHKCLDHDRDFTVIGAYPAGQNYDIMKGKKDERPAADERIRSVPLPGADPVFGAGGPLMKHWGQ